MQKNALVRLYRQVFMVARFAHRIGSPESPRCIHFFSHTPTWRGDAMVTRVSAEGAMLLVEFKRNLFELGVVQGASLDA